MKIAILANKERQDQIFNEGHFRQLKAFGELSVNEGIEGPTAEEAASLITGADIAVTSWNCPAMTEDILREAPGLGLVVHGAGSVKGLVTDDLWARGIRVTSAASALGKGVAETALGMTLASLKNIYNLSTLTSMGGWNSQNHTVRDIYGLKIGVIGAGHAGRHYIKLMQNFEVEILLYDPTVDDAGCLAMGVKKASLLHLMSVCDVVSIHAPSLPVTRHMINAENLSGMKDGAVLINTARGTLINEDDLINELRKGRISACIDVTDPEPPSELNELRLLPNVILTPHIAGAVTNGRKRIGALVVEEIGRFIEHGGIDFEVLPGQLGRLA